MNKNNQMIHQKDTLEKLVKFHLENFDKDEISILLGQERIKYFYESIMKDANCKLDFKMEGENITFVIVFIKKYTRFTKNQRFRSLWTVFIKLVQRKITFSNLFDAMAFEKNVRKFIPKPYRDNGLGVAIINPEFNKDIKHTKEFFRIYCENIESVQGCWGSCRTDNVRAIRLLKHFGGKIAGTANGNHFFLILKVTENKN